MSLGLDGLRDSRECEVGDLGTKTHRGIGREGVG